MDNAPVTKMEVGKDLGMIQYRLTAWRLLKYIDTTGDENPWYRVSSPFGGIIAPPTILDSDLLRLSELRRIVDLHPRRLLAGEEYKFYHPVRLGKMITVRGKIAEVYVKGKKEYVVFEGLCSDEDGLDLAQMRITYCWPME